MGMLVSMWKATVSIPFKRESLSKVARITDDTHEYWGVSIPFKRESLSKGNARSQRRNARVSIPFKRESLSKEVATALGLTLALVFRFNSLQTGKPIQSLQIRHRILNRVCVSIPFKRESLSKGELLYPFTVQVTVSIPFKRESLSKRPHFKPSGAVAPYAQKHTRSARGNFLAKF